MKRKFITIFFLVCSALLTAGFAAHLYIDYTQYYEFSSAPLWLYAAERSIEYLIPAIGCLIAGLAVRKGKKPDTGKGETE